MWCIPWWHAQLDEWASDTRSVTNCPVIMTPDARFPTPGFVPCNPEALRQSAEKKLRALGVWPKDRALSLDAYGAARLIRSEWGSGPAEAKVVFVECAMNRAKLRKQSVSTLLFTNKYNLKNYGRQHAVSGYTSQGRWASTAKDPTVGDILIADFVLQGKSQNFARGGDQFLDPAGMGDRLVTVLRSWMKTSVWVGHLPGISTKRLFVLRHVGTPDAAGRQLNEAGLDALASGEAPSAPDTICPSPGSPLRRILETTVVLGASVAVGVGLSYGAAELARRRYKDWPFE